LQSLLNDADELRSYAGMTAGTDNILDQLGMPPISAMGKRLALNASGASDDALGKM